MKPRSAAKKLLPFYDLLKQSYFIKKDIVPSIQKSEKDWKKGLTVERFEVMRQFNHAKPLKSQNCENSSASSYFTCAACDLPVYHMANRTFSNANAWLTFSNCIENGVHLQPEKVQNEPAQRKISDANLQGAKRTSFFAPLNGKSTRELDLRCTILDNVPFNIPAMGRHSSISKDGSLKPMIVVCAACKSFLGEFFRVKHSRKSTVYNDKSLRESGKHVIFPISVKIQHVKGSHA